MDTAVFPSEDRSADEAFFDPFDEDVPEDDTEDYGEPLNADELSADQADFGEADTVDEESVEQTKEERVDTRPPAERLHDLLEGMKPQRNTLLEILRLCETRQPVADVNARIEEIQRYNQSVFSPAAICALLERAGGLVRVTEDGTPFDQVEVPEQVVVDEDGVECVVPGEQPEDFWQSTPEGLAIAAEDDPAARLRALLDHDEAFLRVYKRVFQMAATAEGATRDALFAALDPTLATIKPRLYSPYFVDKLNKCNAIEWRGAWYITPLGQACLDSMTDIEDIPSPAQGQE